MLGCTNVLVLSQNFNQHEVFLLNKPVCPWSLKILLNFPSFEILYTKMALSPLPPVATKSVCWLQTDKTTC